MLPSRPIRPHSASHCFRVRRFALYGVKGEGEEDGNGTHEKAQKECMSSSTASSRSFIARVEMCSTVVWFVVISAMCVESMAVVNNENIPALRYFIRCFACGRDAKRNVHSNDDDMLRIDILLLTRGSTHVEREEGRERPKSKEYAPHHKDEEKLTSHGYMRQPITAAQLKSKSPFGSARQRTGRSLRCCTVSLLTRQTNPNR
jgi:hypothetical protein